MLVTVYVTEYTFKKYVVTGGDFTAFLEEDKEAGEVIAIQVPLEEVVTTSNASAVFITKKREG